MIIAVKTNNPMGLPIDLMQTVSRLFVSQYTKFFYLTPSFIQWKVSQFIMAAFSECFELMFSSGEGISSTVLKYNTEVPLLYEGTPNFC